jgi:membrane protease YdiL (CAAX protease family)
MSHGCGRGSSGIRSPRSCAGIRDDFGTGVRPRALTEPGLLPGGATLDGALENVPAFIVAALVSGKAAGVRDLARRSLRWRVPLRWYLISLLAPLLILLIAVKILYGFAPPRALAQNWLQLFTAFLPALAIMIVLNNVAEEIRWTGFVFARFQDRHDPLRAALLTTLFFWLFHVPTHMSKHDHGRPRHSCWAVSTSMACLSNRTSSGSSSQKRREPARPAHTCGNRVPPESLRPARRASGRRPTTDPRYGGGRGCQNRARYGSSGRRAPSVAGKRETSHL